MPLDIEGLLTGDGKLLHSSWVIDEVFVKRLGRWFKRKPWFLKKKYLAWAIAKGYVVPPSLPRRKPRPGRRRRDRWTVNGYCNRFRELNPNLDPIMGVKSFGALGSTPIGVSKTYANGVVQSVTNRFRTGDPSGSIHSSKTWDRKNPGPPYRTGGPFAKLEVMVPSSQSQRIGTVSNIGSPGITWANRTEYTGSFYDNGLWGTDLISSYLQASRPVADGYDTLAWDKTKPQLEKAQATQFLVELRDMPRMLESTANLLWNSWRSFGGGYSKIVMHPRSAADAFVNHEFGWAPFLSDIVKMHDVFVNTEKYIAQTVRDNGQWVRRRAVLENDETHTVQTNLLHPGVDPWGSYLQQLCRPTSVGPDITYGHHTIDTKTSKKVWAVGCFKYYRPEFDDNLVSFGGQLANLRRLITLYGLRINPTVVWKLTPWSWAVDWFSSVGSFISRHDDFTIDGIVAKYLYVMKTEEKELTKTSVMNFYSGPVTLHWQRKFSQKARKVADSPYGFDRPWNNISLRQAAILGAIGVSRTPNGYRLSR